MRGGASPKSSFSTGGDAKSLGRLRVRTGREAIIGWDLRQVNELMLWVLWVSVYSRKFAELSVEGTARRVRFGDFVVDLLYPLARQVPIRLPSCRSTGSEDGVPAREA